MADHSIHIEQSPVGIVNVGEELLRKAHTVALRIEKRAWGVLGRTSKPLPGEGRQADEGLREALPAVREAARQVGGLKRLSEIAAQLDRAGGV